MIGWTLVLPTVAAVGAGLFASLLHDRVRPSFAAAGLTFLAAVGAIAVVGVVGLVAALFLSQLPLLGEVVAFCGGAGPGHAVPIWLGFGALVVLGGMIAAARVQARRHRPLGIESTASLVVLPFDEPTAYAVPGRPGQVVVSAGMLRSLDGPEQRVLLAHETSHLRRHHHRYLAVAGLATAVAPVLHPLRARVRLATERWADEDAVASVGDRALVARTIARAALAQHDAASAPRLAAVSCGVGERVRALLDEPKETKALRASLLCGIALSGLAGASVQLHHLVTLATHVCGM